MPQKTGITIPRIRHKPNSCAFVSLQGKTLFIWQIKVAKTAKAKLCATKNRHNYPKNSAQAEFLSFVPLQRKTAVSLTNQGCKGCQNEALCSGGKKLCVQFLLRKGDSEDGVKLCAPGFGALCTKYVK